MKKIHSTFHIGLLEKTHSNARVATNIEIDNKQDDNTEYEAEKYWISNELAESHTYHLVKWKGYPTSENTWEPINHLRNCADLVRQFREYDPIVWGNYVT